MKKKVKKWLCKRCGWSWETATVLGKPGTCPECGWEEIVESTQ